MTIKTVPHINFRGDARSALDFYQSVFGGDITIVTYQDAHAVQDPEKADQVMWGQVASSAGFAVMAYDVPSRLDWNAGEIPFFVSVRGEAEEISRCWTKLCEGATILQALGPANWAAVYGMLKDKFGVTWVLDAPNG